MRKTLAGRTILVTGVAGGIGRALLSEMTARGALVVGTGRGRGWMEALGQECEGISPKPVFLEADVSSDGAWERLIAELDVRNIRIDILIHAAGVYHPGPIGSFTPDEIREMIGSNFIGIVLGTNALLPLLRQQQRSGQIIAIGSLGGVLPMPYEALYAATKFAVRGFFLSLYQELKGSGIDVTLISPGPVRTRLLDREAATESATLTFATRALRPEVVARATYGAIRRPRREISVPSYGGFLSSLINASSWTFAVLYPLLDWIGTMGRKRYRRARIIE